MTKNVGYTDQNVTRIEVDHSVSSGVQWGSLGEDMVPLFEEHAERVRKKYTMVEWYALDPLERAMIIAVNRIDSAMHNLQTEAEIKAAKKGSKK